jgi:anti-anti-sigma regulatory factor
MVKINFNKKDSSATIKFEQPLLIQNIMEIKDALVSAISKADKIILDHDAVEYFDISYLQLLIAAQKSMKVTGKKLIIAAPKNNSFQDFLENSGCKQSQFFFDEADNKKLEMIRNE